MSDTEHDVLEMLVEARNLERQNFNFYQEEIEPATSISSDAIDLDSRGIPVADRLTPTNMADFYRRAGSFIETASAFTGDSDTFPLRSARIDGERLVYSPARDKAHQLDVYSEQMANVLASGELYVGQSPGETTNEVFGRNFGGDEKLPPVTFVDVLDTLRGVYREQGGRGTKMGSLLRTQLEHVKDDEYYRANQPELYSMFADGIMEIIDDGEAELDPERGIQKRGQRIEESDKSPNVLRMLAYADAVAPLFESGDEETSDAVFLQILDTVKRHTKAMDEIDRVDVIDRLFIDFTGANKQRRNLLQPGARKAQEAIMAAFITMDMRDASKKLDLDCRQLDQKLMTYDKVDYMQHASSVTRQWRNVERFVEFAGADKCDELFHRTDGFDDLDELDMSKPLDVVFYDYTTSFSNTIFNPKVDELGWAVPRSSASIIMTLEPRISHEDIDSLKGLHKKLYLDPLNRHLSPPAPYPQTVPGARSEYVQGMTKILSRFGVNPNDGYDNEQNFTSLPNIKN